jgi:3-isopropylmalate/(R)-2-methylmalate dehydratase small subunit
MPVFDQPVSPPTNTLRGRVWTFGDWVSGDDGIVRFSELRNFADDHDPDELAHRLFEGLVPDFAAQVSVGDMVVAGRGFGIPSHPIAAQALRAAGISAAIVESTDSAFIRRSLNAGLAVVTCPGVLGAIHEHDEVALDLLNGRLTNLESGVVLRIQPFSPAMLEILDSGGLVPYLQRYVTGVTNA